MAEFMQVFVTVPDPSTADRLANHLLEEGLAACIQVFGSVRSSYQWQGHIERTDELMMLIKTSRRLFPELSREIESLHPYDTPEILAVPVADGSARYLEWLGSSLALEPGED